MSEYAFNPLTGNLDRVGDGGGGGGNITITTDEGTPVTGDNFIIEGQEFRSAPVMQVTNDGPEIRVINNSWTSAYVVALETDPGETGTFPDLQSAIDAIVADGVATDTQAGLIIMRPGAYVYEDPITIPANVIIEIKGNVPAGGVGISNFQADVWLNANIVIDPTATLYIYNLFCVPDAGDAVSVTGGNFFAYNCSIGASTMGGFINLQCCYADNLTIESGSLNASQCNQLGVNLVGGSAYFFNCGTITVNHHDGQIVVWQCTGINLLGDATSGATVFLYDTPINQMITDTAAAIYVGNITANTAGLQSGGNFFGDGTNPKLLQRIKANCYLSKLIDADYAASRFDYFIGVKGNSTPVTVVFPTIGVEVGTKGQSWIIADLEGTAATNNITISITGGTINNKTSIVINKNFGSVEIYYDGTSYFTIQDNSENPETLEPVGELAYFATGNGDDYIDSNWLRCQGQILQQSDYPLLFERLGFVNGPYTQVYTTTTFVAQTIMSMIFDGTRFVAGAQAANIGTSTDGKTWSSATSPGGTGNITDISFDGSLYVVQSGQNAFTSTNLATYTAHQNSPAVSNYLARSGTRYVSGQAGGKFISFSNDGIAWSTRSPVGSRMVYGNSKLVQGGPLGLIQTSPDSTTWSVSNGSLSTNVNGLTPGGGLFVATFSSSSSVGVSTDGYVWSAVATGTTATWSALTYGNSLWVMGGVSGVFRCTTDFVTFTAGSTGIGGNISNLTYGNSLFAATISSSNTIVTSTNGSTWSQVTATASGSVVAIKFMNGNFYASSQAGLLGTSTDATTWSWATKFGSAIALSFEFMNSLYVAGLNNGSIASSTDAITWSTNTTATTSGVNALAFDGTIYWASNDVTTMSSTNLVSWTIQTNLPLATNETINDVTAGNSEHIITTNIGNIWTSPDTLSWTSHATTTGILSTTLYLNNRYFALGGGGRMYVSTDLTTFNSIVTNTTSAINAMDFTNGIYLAAGSGGYVRTSTDGLQWDQLTSPLTTQTTLTMTHNSNVVTIGGSPVGFLGYLENVYPYDETTEFQLPTDAQIGITNEYPSNFRRALYIKAL